MAGREIREITGIIGNTEIKGIGTYEIQETTREIAETIGNIETVESVGTTETTGRCGSLEITEIERDKEEITARAETTSEIDRGNQEFTAYMIGGINTAPVQINPEIYGSTSTFNPSVNSSNFSSSGIGHTTTRERTPRRAQVRATLGVARAGEATQLVGVEEATQVLHRRCTGWVRMR
ncbi:unnamed protein product [Sphagnum balticum]